MRAVVQDTYGSADILQLRDIDKPLVGDNNVLVRVHAAGVDPGVWHLMTGLPYLVRIMGHGLRTPKVRIRGRDVAGRVEAVGKDVTQVQPGEEVFGICDGSFAQYACARPDKLAPKPANLSFQQAAAVPISALTALQALRDAGKAPAASGARPAACVALPVAATSPSMTWPCPAHAPTSTTWPVCGPLTLQGLLGAASRSAPSRPRPPGCWSCRTGCAPSRSSWW